MTGWGILAGWLVGWLLAVRPSMRRTMLQQVCAGCGHSSCACRRCSCYDSRRFPTAARGAVRERTGGDVAHALWVAAWWPLWLTVVLLRKAFTALGAGVTTAVIRATPLTGPELERRIAERETEIERLTKLVSDGDLSVNQARERAGLPALDEAIAARLTEQIGGSA